MEEPSNILMNREQQGTWRIGETIRWLISFRPLSLPIASPGEVCGNSLCLMPALCPLMLCLLMTWAMTVNVEPTHADAWSDARVIRNKVNQLRKTNPQAAAQTLEQALESVTNASVAADLFTLLGNVYTTDLKKPEAALKLFDRALPIFKSPQHKVPAHHWITMIAAKANALVGAKRLPEAQTLLHENHAALLEAADNSDPYANDAVRQTLSAHLNLLQAQEKTQEWPEVLARFVVETPRAWTLGAGDSGDWAFKQLLDALQKQKRIDEALGWAKLRYRLCAFNKGQIEAATQVLARLWAAQENFPAVRLFNKAQTDPTATNPIATIKLPELSAEARDTLQERLAVLEERQRTDYGPAKARDIVTIRLLLGTPSDVHAAMLSAQQLLRERPEAPESALQICRVFKAVDDNLVRANAFLSYLEGEGENPVPALLQELQQKIQQVMQQDPKPDAPGTNTPKVHAPKVHAPTADTSKTDKAVPVQI